MKKKNRFVLLAALVLVIAVFGMTVLPDKAYADSPLVVDNADLFSDIEEQQLELKAQELSSRYGFAVAILTEQTVGQTSSAALIRAESNPEQPDRYYAYAAEYAEETYGLQPGVLLFYVEMGTRFYTLDACGQAETVFTKDILDRINPDVADYLSEGNYYGSGLTFFSETEDMMNEYSAYQASGFDGSFSDYLNRGAKTRTKTVVSVVGTVISFIIALIVTAVMKAKMKTAKMQVSANQYIAPGAFHLTGQSDIFLYSTVSRTKKSDDKQRSGGGFGGGSFHSSSGGSHSSSGGHF